MNIYKQKNTVKAIFIFVAMLIAIATLYYTNVLVNKLAEREEKLIDLYAKGMQHIINSEDNENIGFLFSEIVEINNSIPVILTDENYEPIPNRHRNIDLPENATEEEINSILKQELTEMMQQHPPIEVAYQDVFKNYVFYKNSFLLTQLKYYPFVQLLIIGSFIFVAYLAFSYSRKSEQNNVWVGMAKETAHQLGTPLSALMGWLDYFKNSDKFKNEMVINELEKDIERLGVVTERFSNIGSIPVLQSQNILESTTNFINYYKKRVSQKVHFNIQSTSKNNQCLLNIPLYEWVLENLCKNAVDAMQGKGNLTISINDLSEKQLAIYVQDTGSGMTKDQKNKVFSPGFTTKKRGWGLGLSLTKRIVEEYHKGKIIVKETSNKGTTFEIILHKS